MDSPDVQHSLNSVYEVPRTITMLYHLSVFMQYHLTPREAINHVCKLPSIDPAIQYLHVAAGLPTKHMCLKAIQKFNYLPGPS